MESRKKFGEFLLATTLQVRAYTKRENSRAEKEYSFAMKNSAAALAELTRYASFEELIQAEATLQENDLSIYAQRPATMESVREGIDDFAAGMAVYRQLLENPAAYVAHKYRRKECLPPDYVIPLDAMRRALRGQVKRVENYRANVMGNAQEQEFLSARILMLRRAEELYDNLQKACFQ